MTEKLQKDIVFIGHVDHGKSTLVARLLLDSGSINPHLIEKYRERAKSIGKSSFELAWVMDDLKEERERGVTIRAQIRQLSTNKFDFTLSDTPGHKLFIKNMIRGTRQAEAAILLVAAPEGIMPQTKEHLYLAKTFGINQLIIAISKMDDTYPPYNEDRYHKVKSEMEELLKRVGYDENQYDIIPVSGYYGDNIISPSDNLKWYNGKPLINLMNGLEPSQKSIDLPLRWPIRDLIKVSGRGYIPVGFIATGSITIGANIIFMPSGKEGEVRSMEVHHKPTDIAFAGDPVGVDIRLIGAWDKKKEIRSGYVAGLKSNIPSVAKTFTAQIIIFNHPTALHIGYAPIIHCHEAHVKCIVLEMKNKMDQRTGEILEESPTYLRNGDIAVVKFQPLMPLVIEKVDEFPTLGRFAIRDMGETIGAGMVIELENINERK